MLTRRRLLLLLGLTVGWTRAVAAAGQKTAKPPNVATVTLIISGMT